PRLDKCDLKLSWHIEDLPPLKNFGPREALHILRILQEAVSNSIKHAQADHLSLVARALPQADGPTHISIELSDNGRGMGHAKAGGKGLKNMRYRAQKIGACLHIDSDTGGTQVQLLLAV
ncbi:MAG TPA: histidine kinase, partial [Gammaproteobacteria bacterium]|nr:histidine kinase [Gammaproteobacteria bacterium]